MPTSVKTSVIYFLDVPDMYIIFSQMGQLTSAYENIRTMNIFINLIFIGLASHYTKGKSSTRFDAISDSIFGRELYHKLKNEGN